MTVYRDSKKPLRDWLISGDDAAKALHVNASTFRALVDEGYIRPAQRKGFYRMGAIMDGHAEAVRMGRIPAPHARSLDPGVFWCPVPQKA